MSQGILERLRISARKAWKEHVIGDVSDVGSVPAAVAVSNEQLGMHGLHSIFEYDQYDPENGIFYNDNSISFCFEVIPQTGADEDMALRMLTMLSPVPAGYGIQWCMFGNPVVDEKIENYKRLRRRAVNHGETVPFFVELADKRLDYIAKHRGRPLWPNENYSVRDIRLVFSVTKNGSFLDHALVEEILELKDTLLSSMKSANLPAYVMDAEMFLRFMWPIMNPEVMFSDEEIAIHYDDGKSVRDQLTKYGKHVRVKSDRILHGLPPESRNEEDKRIASRTFGILSYPQRKELWEMHNIIGAFFDDSLQYPCPFLICGGIFTLDFNAVENKTLLQAARTKNNAESKMARFQPELSMQAQDWDIVLHQLGNGGNMCEIYHTLTIFSPTQNLNRVSQVAINVWRNGRFSILPLEMLQLPTLKASMPMTFTQSVRDDLKAWRILSLKTTINAIDMSPVIGEWRGAGDPIMLFYGRRGTPTPLDFYSNKQGNYNVFVAGVSGSGKSVAMNEIVSAYRGIGARVWVIDVGRSYQNLIKMQGGTFLEFTQKANICINPFSWVGTDEENAFKDEMRMLKPMIGRMASPNADLGEFEYALLEEAITGAWNDYGQETNPTLIRDYLLKIQNESGGKERVAFELAKQLQPFTKDGIYGGFFNGRANIDIDADMVGLELEELKNAPSLRRVVLFVLTSRIAHDMYLSRDRKKICLVDEAWQLLGADKETAEFIEEGYRRARKYNGIFCVGTQGIADAYKNAASEAAYNNADWKILLRQDPKVLGKLIEDGVVNFSPSTKKMLTSLRTEGGRFSEMLISSPNGEHVVRHIPDPFSLLMASTLAKDYEECNALLDQGYSTMAALEIMLQRRQ